MKRKLAILVLCVLLLSAFSVFPAFGADDAAFATLEYVCDADDDGNVESGFVRDDIRFVRAVTISVQSEDAVLYVGGAKVEEGSVRLERAGHYNVQVAKADKPTQKYVYDVFVMPFLDFNDGKVFVDYPTIVCENVESMQLDGKPFTSGDTVSVLGAHTLTLVGKSGYLFNVGFYVKLCHAERVFDEASGKEALAVHVGEFEGAEIMLDGAQRLEAGTHIVTAVGQHTVSAELNGSTVEDANLLPTARQLNLQVLLHLLETESNEPIFMELSRWDADFYLDGKLVKGDCRIEKDGTHTLEVRNADGEVMEDVFLLVVGDSLNPEVCTSLELTFHNPHNTYVIFLIVPACLLVGLAACFLVIRRRIV